MTTSKTEHDEEWRRVPGWKHYEVSNLGRVRSLDRIAICGTYERRHRGRVLRTRFNGRSRGQVGVTLTEDGVRFHCSVRRLVAAAFLSMPLDSSEFVYHINGDNRDCALDNLRVGTRLEVASHTMVRGAHHCGESSVLSKLTRKDVREIIDLLVEGDLTQKAIGKRFGVSADSVRMIKSGKRWRAVEYGHRFSRDDIT